jgi:hypothetical protein
MSILLNLIANDVNKAFIFKECLNYLKKGKTINESKEAIIEALEYYVKLSSHLTENWVPNEKKNLNNN